jgi:glycolate oxidase FAD binding subunit
MRLQPLTQEELLRQIAEASAGAVHIESVDLSAFNRIVEYAPEDMTATAQGGMSLAAFQTELALRKQWLPIDPPNPERVTIGKLLDFNLSGPRRYGYGTIRDYLIGIKVAMADGQIIRAGGKVVKNVAGYDLCKLFVGSRGTLGVILEVTFKLWPLPEKEIFLSQAFDTLAAAQTLFLELLQTPLRPVVLDLHNLESKNTIVLGFAGTTEEVDYQQAKAMEMGFDHTTSLNYETAFFTESMSEKASVLASNAVSYLQQLAPEKFVARLGNGVIYFRNASEQPSTTERRTAPPRLSEGVQRLTRRVKEAYDPKHIFPEF